MLRHNTVEVIGVPSTALLSNNVNHLNNNTNPISITHSNTNTSGSALDALPKQFVMSMKTLFDILDDQHTGLVKLAEIEKGWQDDGCKGLPYGVIDSLRKVTPTSGLLSFERFCAGLKLCLLRNQNEATKTNTTNSSLNVNNHIGTKVKSPLKTTRPPSAPVLAIDNPISNTTWSKKPLMTTATATVRPHHIAATQRAISMPQLSPDSELEVEFANVNSLSLYNTPQPPPKPPRAAASTANGILTTASSSATSTLDKTEIRHALQNWQMGVLLNEMDAKDKRNLAYMHPQFDYRGSADGGSSSATDSVNGTIAMHVKKITSKRREPRRHTLQNGIDYNMLKRLKQFEEEREVLLLGLDAVEKARDWYLKQVVNVQEKIKYLGRMGSHLEQWSEVQQERLNFQRARVLEVNRNLAALADSWEHGGFPVHFNLAIRTPTKAVAQRPVNSSGINVVSQQSVDRLRQQNRKLANDVNLKNECITLLEREKQTLMTQLYNMQQRIGITGLSNGFVNVHSQSSPVCSSSSGGLGDADVVF